MSSSRVARSALGVAVRVALVVIGFAPLWVVPARTLVGFGWLTDALDFWFSVQCHRDAARTWNFDGFQAEVCARCMGIYIGLGLGGLVARPRLSARAIRLLMLFALGLMALDISTELLALRAPEASLRGLTGALLSYPAAIAVVQAVRSVTLRR